MLKNGLTEEKIKAAMEDRMKKNRRKINQNEKRPLRRFYWRGGLSNFFA